MSKMRLNIPLLIYNPNTSGTTKNKNYICQTDILKLIKNYLINNTDQQNKIINSIQDENVISESIFNEIYQASIRNKNHIYYFSCEFNSLNFTVNLKKQYLDKIENLNSDEKSKEDEIKIYYKNLIFKHLLKSKKLKVLN